MSKKAKLLQRLIDAVGDCEDTDAILKIVEEAQALLHPRICSFCHKAQHLVKYLVVANKDVAICNDCVTLAADVISDYELRNGDDDKSA